MTFYSLLNTRLFGNSIEQYFTVFLVLLLTFIFSKLLFYIFKIYFQSYTKKTKKGLDNAIINVVSGPLVWFFIIIGLYYATAILNMPQTLKIMLGHLTTLALTGIISYFIVRIFDAIVTLYIEPYVKNSESKLDDQLLPVFRRTVKVFIVLISIVVALNNLGYNVTSLLAGLGIGGLAIALAAQETLGNVFGSVSIFADKVFEVGDVIKVGDIGGTVKEVGIRSTRLETPYGTMVAIPNSKIASEKIENITQIGTKRITTTIGITYNTSKKKLDKAIEILKKILKENANTKKISSEYYVYFTNFGVYTLDLQMIYTIPTIKSNGCAATAHDINLRIKELFDKNKIEFALPMQTLYMKR